jgi:hypothetical protein
MRLIALLTLILGSIGCGQANSLGAPEILYQCGNTIYVKDGHHYSSAPIEPYSFQTRYHPQPVKAGRAVKQPDGMYLLTWGGYGDAECSFGVFADSMD